MHPIKLLAFIACLLTAATLWADDDVMVTRDGSMFPVKIEKMSSSQVTFIDLKQKKRGRLNAPADFVYVIIKDKGNNIFFDEEGNQTTSPRVKFKKDDYVLFLNCGQMFVVYQVAVGKDEISYKLKNKKKAPVQTVSKDEVFMLRNADGTTTLFNDSYQERQRQKQRQLQEQRQAETTARGGLLASSVTEVKFLRTPDLSAVELETAVNAKNPFTLYRKGSVAEYAFQYEGRRTEQRGGDAYYVQQVVADEKVENGVLTAYIRQDLFDKNHSQLSGYDLLFPVEIDTVGNYHMTHNPVKDVHYYTKRQGFCIMMPGDLQQGMQLKCGTMHDTIKSAGGLLGSSTVETSYSNWQVVGYDRITTPAGTFDCVKLTGQVSQKSGRGAVKHEQITCWMARGIGVVQYESVANAGGQPYVAYLNSVDIK